MESHSVTVPWKSQADIWKEAERIRKGWWDSSVPVNVDIIAEKELRLAFIPIDGLLALVSTEAHLTGDLQEIDYDPSANNFRLRFSIAHEIGHFVLHPSQIRELRSGSFAEWKEVIANLDDGAAWGRAEYQANEFAGRLLVPVPDLTAAVKEMKPKIKQAREQMKKLEDEAIIQYVSSSISKKFAVSASVISKRLKSEKISL